MAWYFTEQINQCDLEKIQKRACVEFSLPYFIYEEGLLECKFDTLIRSA